MITWLIDSLFDLLIDWLLNVLNSWDPSIYNWTTNHNIMKEVNTSFIILFVSHMFTLINYSCQNKCSWMKVTIILLWFWRRTKVSLIQVPHKRFLPPKTSLWFRLFIVYHSAERDHPVSKISSVPQFQFLKKQKNDKITILSVPDVAYLKLKFSWKHWRWLIDGLIGRLIGLIDFFIHWFIH